MSGGSEEGRSRVALVTGGSRGLGAAIARALAAAGWRVAISYRERAEAAAAVVASGGATHAVRLELADDASVRAAVAEVEAGLGPVEALVANAGIADERPFPELDDAAWTRMLDVNLVGAVRCVRAVLPGMLARRFGRVVLVSSIGGQWGGRNQVHYAASKAALVNLAHSLSNLYAAEGITANAVAPGLVETEMSAAELATEAGRAKAKSIPLGRLGRPEEVGAVAAYLCSDDAGYVTGQTLNPNGGMLG